MSGLSPLPPVRAVCWDMGGVILRTHDWRRRRRWERRLGLLPGSLEPLVFENEVSRQAMLGRARVSDIWASVGEGLRLNPEDLHALQSDFFEGDSFDQDLAGFIAGLRPRLKTTLISNAWPGVRPFLEASLAAGTFDVMVISSEIGLAKPEAGIYRRALEALEVPPEATIFVDDVPRNLDGAAAVGLRPLLFNGTRRTIEAVQRMIETSRGGSSGIA